MATPKPDPQQLLEQEQALILPRFNPDDAWRLGVMLRDRASEMHAPVAIVIEVGPTRLFSALLPGATNDNLEWARRKIATAWRFQCSSYVTALKFQAHEGMFELFGMDYPTYAAAGGAVPIEVEGVGMVGVAAISGLPQEDDHRLVVEALGALGAALNHQEGD